MVRQLLDPPGVISGCFWTTRLEGTTGQHQSLKREASHAGRRDKEAQVRGVCERCLWLTDFRPAYRGIQTLRSSRPTASGTTVKAAVGTTLMGESEIRVR